MEIVLTLKAADVQLVLEGAPRRVLWQVVRAGVVGRAESDWGPAGVLIWSRKGVEGSLPNDMRTMAAGKVWPTDVGTGTIDVSVGVRADGGLEGFEQRTVVVANGDGTWSPVEVSLTERLVLWTRG